MLIRTEWGGIQHKEKTKHGDEIIRLSKNGNIRIVYRQFAIQCKYAIEHKTENGYWDRLSTAKYSSDFIGEVEKAALQIPDIPISV